MQDKRLSHITSPEERGALAQLLDLADRCVRLKSIEVSVFLSPRLLLLAKDILRGIKDISFMMQGGYPDAERQKIIIWPDFMICPDNIPIDYLQISVKGGMASPLAHRDLMGAVLGLGIDRSTIGDIRMLDDHCGVLVIDSIMSQYVIDQLEKAGRQRVVIERIRSFPDFHSAYIDGNVVLSSLRLDLLVSKAFNLSRKEADILVRSGAVKLNFKTEQKSNIILAAGDILSVRGYGRAVFLEDMGKNKKDKPRILIRRYI